MRTPRNHIHAGKPFATDPSYFLTGPAREPAIANLRAYFRQDDYGYTGSWFERIADNDHPDHITPRDIAAVGALGVNIPAHITIWLLDDGMELVRSLLEQIPVGQAIWDDDADLGPAGPAEKLWRALRSAMWAGRSKGLGRTMTSKLIAAKRPHLVPIYDDRVARALWAREPKGSYWEPWRDRLRGEAGQQLRTEVEALRADSGVGQHLSVLRVLDVIIWMWARQTRDPAWDLGFRLRPSK